MAKLIAAYRKLPSPSNRTKLAAYIDKHFMATCCLDDDDFHFLKVHGFLK